MAWLAPTARSRTRATPPLKAVKNAVEIRHVQLDAPFRGRRRSPGGATGSRRAAELQGAGMSLQRSSWLHRSPRSRRLLAMTESELAVIAAAASIVLVI